MTDQPPPVPNAQDRRGQMMPPPPPGPLPGAPAAHGEARPQPKQIATLPPLPVLRDEIELSPSTGEPVRPVVLVIASLLLYFAAAAVAVVYGWHWWLAAHPDRYATSAHLIEWVEPEPGKWLSLTLEGVLAALAALVTAACAVTAFQSWNGWRWSRIAGLVTLALTVGFMVLVNWWGGIAVGLAALGVGLLMLPRITRYFREFERHRAHPRPRYRNPQTIFYGRLPRFR